jgi:hypothetical protein
MSGRKDTVLSFDALKFTTCSLALLPLRLRIASRLSHNSYFFQEWSLETRNNNIQGVSRFIMTLREDDRSTPSSSVEEDDHRLVNEAGDYVEDATMDVSVPCNRVKPQTMPSPPQLLHIEQIEFQRDIRKRQCCILIVVITPVVAVGLLIGFGIASTLLVE